MEFQGRRRDLGARYFSDFGHKFITPLFLAAMDIMLSP
jgi:hypothetical protein